MRIRKGSSCPPSVSLRIIAMKFRLDRRAICVTSFDEETHTNRALRYWLTRPTTERLAAVEFLRRQVVGSGARLRRVLRVTTRPAR